MGAEANFDQLLIAPDYVDAFIGEHGQTILALLGNSAANSLTGMAIGKQVGRAREHRHSDAEDDLIA